MAVLTASGGSAPEVLMLRGRREECAVLDGVFGDALAGRSRTPGLFGDPGVRKTALLDYAIESAFDVRIIRAVGVESERELAVAALHQLCLPLADLLDRLPDPQRDALAVTFGLSDGWRRIGSSSAWRC